MQRRINMSVFGVVLLLAASAHGQLVDTFFVTGESPTTSMSVPLIAGQTYLFEVSGVWDANAGGMDMDAEWWFPAGSQPMEENPSWLIYYNDPYRYRVWGDLLINEQEVNWMGTTDGVNFAEHVFSPSHVYHYMYVGTGEPVGFRLEELAGYGDNHGGVTVSIFPEPATLSLLGLGGLALIRRWR